MRLTPEQRQEQRLADKAVAQRLLATPDGERVIRYLRDCWVGNPRPGTNHGEAAWMLAGVQHIADLERLREEGS